MLIILIDNTGIILTINKSAEKIFNLKAEIHLKNQYSTLSFITEKKLKLLISILFFINIAHATVIKDYYALSGPQIIGGNFNSTDNYFDTGLRCVQVDEDRDVEVIYNEEAIVLSTSSINFNSITRK